MSKYKIISYKIAFDSPRGLLDQTTSDLWCDPVREGEFSAPTGQVIATLQKYLSLKYAIDIAYRNFSDRITGPWRDATVKHWYEHAEDERKHQYSIAMKLVALGSDPVPSVYQIPNSGPNLEVMFQSLMDLELEAISIGRELVDCSGSKVGFRVLIENMVQDDGHHLDDLRRMFTKVSQI
jgi:bacterioferritin (cytochrome b1)